MRTLRFGLTTAFAAFLGISGPSIQAATEAIQPADSGTAAAAQADPGSDDPYLWLEEVDGAKALDWVRARNAETEARLRANPEFDAFYKEALATLNSPSRIPVVSHKGKALYNFWKDEQHPRGIYRRTTLDGLRKQPPEWEVVLDIDALSKAEGKPWVFHGMPCLPPEHRHCLVYLSPGGGDANEVREFDSTTREFVKDGFFLPTAKGGASWIDADTVFVGTDFGEGSMTKSGYPRIAKRWKRGTPLSAAETVYTGDVESMSAAASRIRTNDTFLDVVFEKPGFWTAKNFLLDGTKLQRLDLPETADIEGPSKGRLVISLKEDWTRNGKTMKAGTVVVAEPASLISGQGPVDVLFEASASEVVGSVHATEKGILITRLENVKARLDLFEPKAGGGWTRRNIAFPDNGSLEVVSADDDSGDFFAVFESFTEPPTLYHVSGPDWKPQRIVGQEPSFDGSAFQAEQFWATSKDGTKVPYFMVSKKGLELNGKNPTHIFSYGGFRNALTPSYSGSYEALNGAYGKLWLGRGGVFVLACIRGGGEFGPAWHAAALRENRPRSFEDFEAVAADLVTRKVTSPKHIGIEGRSNGGLLVGATFIRHPELYGAVICGSPLSDMRRYHKLLAGASWMDEFGDPDKPEDWAFISKYSPYQNLKKGQPYPAVMFYTSTRDDRVHPGHARKMAARMLELGYPIEYYENIEGGHGGNVTNEQLALRLALVYAHLWSHLR